MCLENIAKVWKFPAEKLSIITWRIIHSPVFFNYEHSNTTPPKWPHLLNKLETKTRWIRWKKSQKLLNTYYKIKYHTENSKFRIYQSGFAKKKFINRKIPCSAILKTKFQSASNIVEKSNSCDYEKCISNLAKMQNKFKNLKKLRFLSF